MDFCPFLFFSSEFPPLEHYLENRETALAWLSVLGGSKEKSIAILNKMFKNDDLFGNFTAEQRMDLYWTVHCFISRLAESNNGFLQTFPFFILEQENHFLYQLTYDTYSNRLKSLTTNMTAKAFEYITFLLENQPLLNSMKQFIANLLNLMPINRIFAVFGFRALDLYIDPPLNFLANEKFVLKTFQSCFLYPINYTKPQVSHILQIRFSQSFLFPKPFQENPDSLVSSLIHTSLIQNKHFIDILYNTYINELLQNLDANKAFSYCSSFANEMFPWFVASSVKKFISNNTICTALTTIIQDNQYKGIAVDCFNKLFADIQLLLNIFDKTNKKCSAFDLKNTSIPKLILPSQTAITTEDINFLLKDHFFMINDADKETDVNFLLCYIALSSVLSLFNNLTSRDKENRVTFIDYTKALETIETQLKNINDQMTLHKLIIEIFSTIFIKNKDNHYICPLIFAKHVLDLLLSYEEIPEILDFKMSIDNFLRNEKQNHEEDQIEEFTINEGFIDRETLFFEALNKNSFSKSRILSRNDASLRRLCEMAKYVFLFSNSNEEVDNPLLKSIPPLESAYVGQNTKVSPSKESNEVLSIDEIIERLQNENNDLQKTIYYETAFSTKLQGLFYDKIPQNEELLYQLAQNRIKRNYSNSLFLKLDPQMYLVQYIDEELKSDFTIKNQILFEKCISSSKEQNCDMLYSFLTFIESLLLSSNTNKPTEEILFNLSLKSENIQMISSSLKECNFDIFSYWLQFEKFTLTKEIASIFIDEYFLSCCCLALTQDTSLLQYFSELEEVQKHQTLSKCYQKKISESENKEEKIKQLFSDKQFEEALHEVDFYINDENESQKLFEFLKLILKAEGLNLGILDDIIFRLDFDDLQNFINENYKEIRIEYAIYLSDLVEFTPEVQFRFYKYIYSNNIKQQRLLSSSTFNNKTDEKNDSNTEENPLLGYYMEQYSSDHCIRRVFDKIEFNKFIHMLNDGEIKRYLEFICLHVIKTKNDLINLLKYCPNYLTDIYNNVKGKKEFFDIFLSYYSKKNPLFLFIRSIDKFNINNFEFDDENIKEIIKNYLIKKFTSIHQIKELANAYSSYCTDYSFHQKFFTDIIIEIILTMIKSIDVTSIQQETEAKHFFSSTHKYFFNIDSSEIFNPVIKNNEKAEETKSKFIGNAPFVIRNYDDYDILRRRVRTIEKFLESVTLYQRYRINYSFRSYPNMDKIAKLLFKNEYAKMAFGFSNEFHANITKESTQLLRNCFKLGITSENDFWIPCADITRDIIVQDLAYGFNFTDEQIQAILQLNVDDIPMIKSLFIYQMIKESYAKFVTPKRVAFNIKPNQKRSHTLNNRKGSGTTIKRIKSHNNLVNNKRNGKRMLLITKQKSKEYKMLNIDLIIKDEKRTNKRNDDLEHFLHSNVKPIQKAINILASFGFLKTSFNLLCSIRDKSLLIMTFINDFFFPIITKHPIQTVTEFLFKNDPGMSFILPLLLDLQQFMREREMYASLLTLQTCLNWLEDAAMTAIHLFNSSALFSKKLQLIYSAEELLSQSINIRTGKIITNISESFPFRPSSMTQDHIVYYNNIAHLQTSLFEYSRKSSSHLIKECCGYFLNDQSSKVLAQELLLQGEFELFQKTCECFHMEPVSIYKLLAENCEKPSTDSSESSDDINNPPLYNISITTDDLQEFLQRSKGSVPKFETEVLLPVLNTLSKTKNWLLIPLYIALFVDDPERQCLYFLDFNFFAEAIDIARQKKMKNILPLIGMRASQVGKYSILKAVENIIN